MSASVCCVFCFVALQTPSVSIIVFDGSGNGKKNWAEDETGGGHSNTETITIYKDRNLQGTIETLGRAGRVCVCVCVYSIAQRKICGYSECGFVKTCVCVCVCMIDDKPFHFLFSSTRYVFWMHKSVYYGFNVSDDNQVPFSGPILLVNEPWWMGHFRWVHYSTMKLYILYIIMDSRNRPCYQLRHRRTNTVVAPGINKVSAPFMCQHSVGRRTQWR